MPLLIFVTVIVIALIAFMVTAIRDAKESKHRLSLYWSRNCTGKEWRRRFPEAPKQEIREFLEIFVDGFAFQSSQRCKFSPDDKVYEVYRSLYPSLGGVDSMELEIFAKNLKKAYGLDISEIPNGTATTLGELFQMIKIFPTSRLT